MNGGVVSTPLPIKLLSLASPGLKPKGRVCEEWTLRRLQTGQTWLELQSQKNAATPGLGTAVATTFPTDLAKWYFCHLMMISNQIWTHYPLYAPPFFYLKSRIYRWKAATILSIAPNVIKDWLQSKTSYVYDKAVIRKERNQQLISCVSRRLDLYFLTQHRSYFKRELEH